MHLQRTAEHQPSLISRDQREEQYRCLSSILLGSRVHNELRILTKALWSLTSYQISWTKYFLLSGNPHPCKDYPHWARKKRELLARTYQTDINTCRITDPANPSPVSSIRTHLQSHCPVSLSIHNLAFANNIHNLYTEKIYSSILNIAPSCLVRYAIYANSYIVCSFYPMYTFAPSLMANRSVCGDGSRLMRCCHVLLPRCTAVVTPLTGTNRHLLV